jgi:hypothetical protein
MGVPGAFGKVADRDMSPFPESGPLKLSSLRVLFSVPPLSVVGECCMAWSAVLAVSDLTLLLTAGDMDAVIGLAPLYGPF